MARLGDSREQCLPSIPSYKFKLGEHITALNPDCHMHVMQVIMMTLISLGSLDCSVCSVEA